MSYLANFLSLWNWFWSNNVLQFGVFKLLRLTWMFLIYHIRITSSESSKPVSGCCFWWSRVITDIRFVLQLQFSLHQSSRTEHVEQTTSRVPFWIDLKNILLLVKINFDGLNSIENCMGYSCYNSLHLQLKSSKNVNSGN